MSFKIVETIDGGKYVLTTVPESWENQGNLRWPKHQSEQLRRDSHSIPESNWLNTNCVVKRKNIMHFEEAEIELKVMSDVSDTDQEMITQKLRSKLANIETDFNKLASHFFDTEICKPSSASKTRLDPCQSLQSAMDNNEIIVSESNPRMESESREEHEQPVEVQEQVRQEGNKVIHAPKKENLNTDKLITNTHKDIGQEVGEQQVFVGNMDILTASTNNLSTKLKNLEMKIDNFIASSAKNQMLITLNQEQIMEKLSKISAQFDRFVKHSATLNFKQTEDLNRVMKIICDEGSLNNFEESLKNEESMDEMIRLYSVVCGNRKGSAINNAYALSDAMFDRHFLSQCSWAGGSRGETSKICFKSYKLTIKLFFKVIHASDNQFTFVECETFFKNILRNAKKRSESKQLKCSAEKKRPKKHKDNET